MQDFRKILADIRRGRIAPVYLLAGEGAYFKEQVLYCLEEKLLENGADDVNYEVFDGEAVLLSTVLESAWLVPMFGAKRLVVVKNAPWFDGKGTGKETAGSKEADELLLSYLQEPSPTTCLVFLTASNPDKRKKVYKELAAKGVVWESRPLAGTALKDFVKDWLAGRGKNISPAALEHIVTRDQGDLGLLVQELEKLVLYLGDKGEVGPEDVEAIMSFPEQYSIFALTDAVGAKESAAALWHLRAMLRTGEQPLMILGMLARQFRLILYGQALAEEGYSQENIARQMQVHPYAVKKALAQSRYYRRQELIEALAKLLDVDVAIKRGQGEPANLLEQVILELCS
ncbi:MAG TPA: DNA polymerase III subunit delta [Clostridia bacterium]|nr:DNA polymerase III subunit delta [Clostridia bacterium]